MPYIYPKVHRYKEYSFLCESIAGISTAIAIPELNLTFDAGLAFPFLESVDHFFISHGHMDHISGLAHVISLKALNKHKPPHIYLPQEITSDFECLMKCWQKLEGNAAPYVLHSMFENTVITLNPRYEVKCFKTHHRVPSLGYTVYEKRKKLKPEFQNFSQDQIMEQRKQGIDINYEISTPLISFTGDTRLDAIMKHDFIKQSQVLLIEATYLDETKPVEHAQSWGHIHLDELIPLLDQFSCEQILITHVSARYGGKNITELIAKKIPQKMRDRIFTLSDLINQKPKI